MDSVRLIGTEEIERAARNIDGSVDRLERALSTFSQDMAALVYRFERIMEAHAAALNRLPGQLPSGCGPL
jgi:hypothetical protein